MFLGSRHGFQIILLFEVRPDNRILAVSRDIRNFQRRAQDLLDFTNLIDGLVVLNLDRFVRFIHHDVGNDMDLVPQMIEGQHGLVEHQRRVIDSEIVGSGLWNVLDGSNHVIAEVAHRAPSERRQVRQSDGFEPRHRRAEVVHEAGRQAIAVTSHQERISTQEGISGNPLASLHAFQKKRVGPAFLQFQKCRDGREEIGDDRFINGNDVSLCSKGSEFIQTGLHNDPRKFGNSPNPGPSPAEL